MRAPGLIAGLGLGAWFGMEFGISGVIGIALLGVWAFGTFKVRE